MRKKMVRAGPGEMGSRYRKSQDLCVKMTKEILVSVKGVQKKLPECQFWWDIQIL